MKKEEVIFREISADYLNGVNKFTQLELSKRLSISISTVNSAIKNVYKINAIQIKRRSFSIIALDRLMLYWATHRAIEKDISFSVHADMPIKEIEASVPDGVAFSAFTAYKKTYSSTPADYSEVYLYATEAAAAEIKKRFPAGNGSANLIVLNADQLLAKRINESLIKNQSVPITQVFADLWNIRSWYAKEFSDALGKKIFVD
ncbi:MAG: hypothetical protein ACYCO0_03460 [Candidatus Micrarchaeaceae archaeon]